jgi:hypothetical protein
MGVATTKALYENQDLISDLVEELHRRGGEQFGNTIRKIECPKCNQPEAFGFVDNPFTIHCPRNNKCGEKSRMSDLVPELFNNWLERYPPTKSDPKATARAFLLSRGLDPSRFEFEQGVWEESGRVITTVAFEMSETKRRWHRLIDIPSCVKGKSRWDEGVGDAYRGKVWLTGKIKETEELWIVEGIFEALSLQQGLGVRAAATFSASHIPTNFYEKLNRSQPITIALNSDNAGQVGTHKNLDKLTELGFEKVRIAQPPDGKDWNDLLCLGQFIEERREQTLKDTDWRGQLLIAESVETYRKIFEEKYKAKGGNYRGLLSFKGETYFCSTKDGKAVTQKILNALIERAFTQVNDEKKYNPEHRDFVKISKPNSKHSSIIELTAAELMSGNKLKESLKSKANVLLLGNSPEIINSIALKLEKDSAPSVRLVERLGYDKKSQCYVFGTFLYDREGRRQLANTDGFFTEQKLVCKTDQSLIQDYQEVDLKRVICLIRRVYGNQGLMVLAFYVATLLKDDFINQKSAFPYLSISGLKGSGKTTLIDFCNQAFFQLWGGLNASRETTGKGMLRTLYHRHSLVIPYNESNKGMIGLDENKLLYAYHGGSLYIRADTTNDANTINLPFHASLAFVQNIEPFTIGAVKERVISLRFKNASEGGVTDDSRVAMKELMRMAASQRAGIGHQIFASLKEIRQQVFSDLDDTEAGLTEYLQSPRVAFTHSVLLSTCQALLSKAGFERSKISEMELVQEVLSLAQKKDNQSGGENDIADTFIENFEQLLIEGKLTFEKQYYEDVDFYWIRLGEVEREMKSAGYPPLPKLSQKIREADGVFVDYKQKRFGGKNHWCYQIRKRRLDKITT